MPFEIQYNKILCNGGIERTGSMRGGGGQCFNSISYVVDKKYLKPMFIIVKIEYSYYCSSISLNCLTRRIS